MVFCVVTPCSFVVGYQCFGGLCCLNLQGEMEAANTRFEVFTSINILVVFYLEGVLTPCSSNLPHCYTVSQPSRSRLKN